jgi:hypothetical protein
VKEIGRRRTLRVAAVERVTSELLMAIDIAWGD